jgi:hypothetical protein
VSEHFFISNGPLTNAAVVSVVNLLGGMGYRGSALVVSEALRDVGESIADRCTLDFQVDEGAADDFWRVEGLGGL